MSSIKNLVSWLLKYKNTMLVIAMLVLVLIVMKQLILSTIDSVFQTKNAIAEDEARLTKLTQKEILLKNLTDNSLGFKEQKLEAAIPSTINLPSILATIQKAALDTNMKLGEFSIASNGQVLTIIPVANAAELSNFRFKTTLTGSIDDMNRFIKKLGTVSPLVHIETLDFVGDRATMVFSFYFEPKSTQQFAVDEDLLPMSEGANSALNEVLKLSPPVL